MFQHRPVSRRQLLKLGLGFAAGFGLVSASQNRPTDPISSILNTKTNFVVADQTSLKQRTHNKGLIYGAATTSDIINQDRQFVQTFLQECEMVVAEWEMKWDAICPSPNVYDFTRGDIILEFSLAHNLLLRGHTLVWHSALPSWFNEQVNHQNAEYHLLDHIRVVAGHYAGKIHSWDVVNEAIEVEDGLPNGLRRSPWLEYLGEDYIEFAFRAAAAADPNALLVLNDFDLEYDNPRHTARRSAILRLLERLIAKDVPVHALGIQSHLKADEAQLNPEQFSRFLGDVSDLGLQIFATELDVIDQKLPADVAVRDQAVANIYADYLSVLLHEPAVKVIVTWGLSDRYTWLSRHFSRLDGLPVRPLLLDENMSRKPAWNAIARAFDRRPSIS